MFTSCTEKNIKLLYQNITHKQNFRKPVHGVWICMFFYKVLQDLEGKTFGDLPFLHRGCCSPSLKELISAVKGFCMGWVVLANRDDSLATVLLSVTASSGSRGYLRTELALRISLFHFFLSSAEVLLPKF